jgi:hypothetical protein
MWRFQLCETPPFGSTAEPILIGELFHAKDRGVELIQNRPGSVNFTISLEHEIAHEIKEGTTCVLAWRDDIDGVQVCRWSGPVWTAEEDYAGTSLRVSCVGWIEELNTRLIRPTQVQSARYTNIDPGAIVLGGAGVPANTSLLSLANKQTDDLGTERPTHITAGSYDPTVDSLGAPITRTINYAAWQSIGQAIQQLSDIEYGFDYSVNPLTRALNIHFLPIKGTIRGKGNDRPDALFTLGWGPRNLQALNRNTEMASVRNRFTATSQSGASGRAEDRNSMALYGIHEEQTSLSDVTGKDMGPILLAYAGGEIVYRAKPQPVWTMTPFPWRGADSNVPRLFDDYDIGDFVYLLAEGGREPMTEPQALRVFGVQLGIDDEGNERISSLQVAPAS